MNYTRVLRAFGGRPQPAAMPVDLATCLNLGQRRPPHHTLSKPPLKPRQRFCQPPDPPPRSNLHPPSFPSSSSSSPLSSPAMPSEPRSCFRRDTGGANKKRVVFADAKGLALTALRLFIPEPSSSTSSLLTKLPLVNLQGLEAAYDTLRHYKLRPAFPQPTQDLNGFLARLREMHVQLESCNITQRSMSGKVCVSHDSAEKAVHLKVTFDSWRSHHDIPCTFLEQQRRRGSDVGVFAFDLILPQSIDPKERIEFCVSFRPGSGATTHWDDNRGQNYRVCVGKDASHGNQGDRCHPTLPKHWSPSWPSPISPTAADVQYLQRSLSSRVRTDWKTALNQVFSNEL